MKIYNNELEYKDKVLKLAFEYTKSFSVDYIPEYKLGSLADGIPGYCLLLLNLYENTLDESYLLEIEKNMARLENRPVNYNNTHSFFGGLIGSGIIYYELNKIKPIYTSKIKKINTSIEKKTITYLNFVEEQLKVNMQIDQYDLFFGITGCVRYFLLFQKENRIFDKLIKRCIKYLEKVTNIILYRIKVIEIDRFNNSKSDISPGLAHGLAGILSVLTITYKTDSNYSYLLNTIKDILYYFDNNSIQSDKLHFKWKTLYRKGGMEYGIKSDDMSWCYGLTGVSRANIISKELLIKDKEVSLIEDNYLIAVSNLLLDPDNDIWENPSLCHGVSGVLYETFLIEKKRCTDYKYTLKLVKKILNIIELNVNRKNEEDEYKYSFLNGFAGSYVALISTLNNKTFIGDYSLLKK